MSTEIATDTTPADPQNAKRTRRALPITKRVSRNGKVSYTFRARPEDVGYSELLATFGEPGIKALDR